MSTLALFLFGAAVTALVAGAMALLVGGAILDGRDERPRRRAELRSVPQPLGRRQTIHSRGDAA